MSGAVPRTAESLAAIQALIELLVDAFPRAFFMYERRRRPLKIGIHLDIFNTMAGAILPGELNAALQFYTGNAGYLLACRPGAARIDLDGAPSGVVSDQHAVRAAARLAGRQRRRVARKAEPVGPAPKRDGLADLREMGRARVAAAAGRVRVAAAAGRVRPSSSAPGFGPNR
jgi:ProP effector